MKKMKLLLAEDEKELSKALKAILESNRYSVDAVYDGEDAIYYMENSEYDAVILDIMMPKVDGITALKTVREKGIDVPIIMLTAKSEVDDKVLGLDSGANDYLTKPFSAKELLARLRVLTREKSVSNTSIITVGNVSLDTTTFEMYSPNGKFRLTNKEYQMMEIFMRNPKHIVSTEQLIEKVWGYDSDMENNVVWVYISYLRKKLISLNANIIIKANRNLGYSLELVENDSK
ncbi:response regulator receiver domain protein [Peptacetobacter hiranonis DSM 13275]|uniref:Stage 0 sporulation protein A homolog n=2 Tax=Peptacetobacter TaxID=2743582 RepID=B6FW42_PEPHT|nr:response regulator receiver domain protein [Peptacetobacter hiranonis DSM 13275]